MKIIYYSLFLLLSFFVGGKTVFAFSSVDGTTASETITVTTKSSANSEPSISMPINDVIENLAADLSTKGKMKDHFRVGMKFFMKDQYDAAIPDLVASTMIVDPYTWNYWYAEAYATLGVIYEFHSKNPNCKKIAYQYYLLALKRDPKTKSANYYIDGIKPQDKLISKSLVEKNKKSISSNLIN